MEDIAELFASLRFAKRIVGGVEERDVWKKLDEVQTAYRKVYETQHERDLALIEERDKTIRELTATLKQIKQVCGGSTAGVEIPKTPAPYQDENSDMKGDFHGTYQENKPDVKGVYRETNREDKPNVRGATREPSKTPAGRVEMKDSVPQRSGDVNRDSRRNGKAAGKSAGKKSIADLSSNSSADSDLAFDWLDDGDFNL